MVNEKSMQVGIVGIGNIGFSICKGLSSEEGYKIFAFDKNKEKNTNVSHYQRIDILENSFEVVKLSDLVILCIRKEQVINWVKTHLNELKGKTLVLMQYGLRIKDFIEYEQLNIVRGITNVNVSENLGHTIFLQKSYDKFKDVLSIFSKLGTVLIVNTEVELERKSLITGCTPAISAMFSKGLENCHNGSIDLLIDVVSNSLSIIKKQKCNPLEYATLTYSKGGLFEECVSAIGENSEFQKIIINWLNPLKKTLE